MRRTLRLALALLTVFPLAPKEALPEEFRRSTAFFPLAGYALGLPLALLALPFPLLYPGPALLALLAAWGVAHWEGAPDTTPRGLRPRGGPGKGVSKAPAR